MRGHTLRQQRHSSGLDDICPTKSFFSVVGLCLQSGATCFHFDELALKKRAITMAKHLIFVIKHSKCDCIRPANRLCHVRHRQKGGAKFVDYCGQQAITLRYEGI
ncbi:hypothetical protein CE195_12980 [Sodalis-like symbiont of Philaenus spumarius]|nr:hypothetical protein CE195_12980 [Sodalis-like symbiont of Philaenus spumarius]